MRGGKAALVSILVVATVASGVAAYHETGEGVGASLDIVASNEESTAGELSPEGDGGPSDEENENVKTGSVNLGTSDENSHYSAGFSGEEDACAGGTDLLAKYEFEDKQDLNGDGDTDDIVYEKGPAGDVFKFSSVETKDDGEVISFNWESEGPYVTFVHVKDNGPTVPDDSVDYEPPTTGPETIGDAERGYSNILFCGDGYQVDFVQGEVLTSLGPDSLYNDEGRLVEAITGSSAETITDRVSPGSMDSDQCLSDRETINVNPSEGTATVKFDVTSNSNCDGVQFALASYRLPGDDTEFVLSRASDQTLVDDDIVVLGDDVSLGADNVVLTVELK